MLLRAKSALPLPASPLSCPSCLPFLLTLLSPPSLLSPSCAVLNSPSASTLCSAAPPEAVAEPEAEPETAEDVFAQKAKQIWAEAQLRCAAMAYSCSRDYP